ncbi:MAG: hypothetical protein RDU14_16615 [Melioribacteraceae bacterium]|nr:hypothetical protein [Melioribacteraceae bacterium]
MEHLHLILFIAAGACFLLDAISFNLTIGKENKAIKFFPLAFLFLVLTLIF